MNSDVLLDNSDLLGFNPFAYCLNNPVLYVDYGGNLCVEHAGGGGMPTNNNSSNNMLDTATAAYIQRTNMEIDMYYTQYEMIKGFAETCYDNYCFSMQLQTQQEMQQAAYVNDFVYDRFSTPEKAANTLAVCAASCEVFAQMTRGAPKLSSALEIGAVVCGIVSAFFELFGEE